MTLPKKAFTFLNLERDHAFDGSAYWVDDDNRNYPEYNEEREINFLVILTKINGNETDPLCAFLGELKFLVKV